MLHRYLVFAYIAISAVTLFTLAWACLAVRRGGFIFALFFFDLVIIFYMNNIYIYERFEMGFDM